MYNIMDYVFLVCCFVFFVLFGGFVFGIGFLCWLVVLFFMLLVDCSVLWFWLAVLV